MKTVFILLLVFCFVFSIEITPEQQCLFACKRDLLAKRSQQFSRCFKKCYQKPETLSDSPRRGGRNAGRRNSNAPRSNKPAANAAPRRNKRAGPRPNQKAGPRKGNGKRGGRKQKPGMMDTSALWQRYRDALFTHIRRAAPTKNDVGLQMVTEPLDANWDQQPTNLGLLANQVSAYGSLYERLPQFTIPRQYEAFLNNLELADRSVSERHQRNIEILRRQLDNLGKQMEDAQIACAIDYEEVATTVKMEYNDFEKLFCPDVNNTDFQQTLVRNRLEEFQTRTLGPMVEVLNSLDNLALDKERTWTDNGELTRFIEAAKNGKADQVTIEVTSATNFTETRLWEKKKKSGFLFFKSSSSDSKKETRLNTESFRMSITATGFAAIRINPQGNWFNPTLVFRYKNTNMWRDKTMTFFGPNGSFPMYPTIYYVMYKPKIILHVSKEDGIFFEQNKHSSFSFGPFQSRRGSTLRVQKLDKDNTLVEFETHAEEPQIVAVESHVF